jgi:pimeloyl-ACP methyl ester carboxylesterase
MGHFRPVLAALGAAGLLAACGGGDGSPVPIITGLAATGAAIANTAVKATCVAGPSVTGTTAADGTFRLVLDGNQTLPCMVQVGTAVPLHGFAAADGRINVTPLSDLVITNALGSDAAAAFATFDATKGAAINAGLAAAKTYVMTQVTALTGGTPSVDLLTGTFAVGDSNDAVLLSLKNALSAAGKTLSDLRLGAVSGASLTAAVARGTLVDPAAVVATLTVAQIDAATAASGLQAISGRAACDVKVVPLNYNTIGTRGEKTNASGVLLVPAGTCTTAAGLVAYAKGTDVQQLRTLANPQDSETFLLIAVYAAQGYAVVATDYLGFARSAYTYHPYLHADSEASSVIDSIRAARLAAATTAVGGSLSGKVMLAGYSQGGHSSMAAHRAIERDNASEINVVGGAYLAGPYNLSGSFKSTAVIAGYQFFVPYLITSWQKVYGNVYSDVTTVFKTPYSGYVESLLPSPTLNYTTLVTSGKLPGINGETPTQARDLMFQSAFITDVQTNNNNALYLAAKKNDLLGWSPRSKVLLCGGAGDPTVPPALHMIPMKADFDSRNLTNVSTVDVDASVQAVYGPGGRAPTDPTSAAFATYYGNYHGSYEPPFCHASAKALFDTVR